MTGSPLFLLKIRRRTDTMSFYEFSKQLEYGKYGEEKFLEFMLGRKNDGKVIKVIDVREDVMYQKKDIDFITIDDKGKETTWEIKTDYYETGNIFLETLVNSYRVSENGKARQFRARKGWLYGSTANYIFYYFAKRNEALIFHRLSVSHWLDDSLQSTHRKSKRIFPLSAFNRSERNPNEIYYGIGMVVPIELLKKDLKDKVKLYGKEYFETSK